MFHHDVVTLDPQTLTAGAFTSVRTHRSASLDQSAMISAQSNNTLTVAYDFTHSDIRMVELRFDLISRGITCNIPIKLCN